MIAGFDTMRLLWTSALLPAALLAQVELVSPLGKKLVAQADEKGLVAKADAELKNDPGNPEKIFAAARARDGIWKFSESIPLYTKGMQVAPTDFRFPRYRGHRYISTRQFDKAVRDLELARKLAPGSFDVAYHLALAHYLKGDFAKAAAEYGRCLDMVGKPESAPPLPQGVRSCAELKEDENTRVAILEWRYRALRRSGKDAEAEKLLDQVGDEMKVAENMPYYETLLMYKGMRTEKQILDPSRMSGNQFSTSGFGIANYHLLEGNKRKACELFRKIVEEPTWSAFGYIAAEAELVRGACKDE